MIFWPAVLYRSSNLTTDLFVNLPTQPAASIQGCLHRVGGSYSKVFREGVIILCQTSCDAEYKCFLKGHVGAMPRYSCELKTVGHANIYTASVLQWKVMILKLTQKSQRVKFEHVLATYASPDSGP